MLLMRSNRVLPYRHANEDQSATVVQKAGRVHPITQLLFLRSLDAARYDCAAPINYTFGVGMPTFLALLRGVNVGKAKRVPMARFRTLLGELGYTNVTTLLNSGNAVFRATQGTPAKLAADIASAIETKLKVEVPVIVKSAKELSAIVSENELLEGVQDHSRLLVAFVQDSKALTELAAIEPLVTLSEQFLIGKGAAYLHCATGILESKAGEALLGKAGKEATTRNWATVLKLQALANEPEA